MIHALVALVHAPVDLVQVLVDLVHAHSPHGGLLLVVSRQVVVRPRLGLIGSVWSEFVRWAEMGLEVGLVVSRGRGELA